MKILVAEDEFLILMWVEEALKDAGYQVVTVSTADHAIEILEKDPSFNIVFTDIDMPGSMDGLRLAAMVDDRWPPMSIVVASGKHRPFAGEMPSKAVFLPKPYLSVDVLTAVNAATNRAA